MKPFRWNIKKREQLGRLVANEDVDPDVDVRELVECAAKVVARSSNKLIVFVGRSPENIFDYLSGIFANTSHEDRIALLNISNRFEDIESIKQNYVGAYASLKDHFKELRIGPKDIIAAPQGVCFCDLVVSGGTFEQIYRILELWSRDESYDFASLSNKLAFVGITIRTKNSPNTWRWQQNADWVKENNNVQVKNVSITDRLWWYLGNMQPKVTHSNPPKKWSSDEIFLPPREKANLKALRLAYYMYTEGTKCKRLFSNLLSKQQEMNESWLRTLIQELRRDA